ncbi:MAG: hypothetical protein ACI81T_001821 [Bacteroidia bacterium]|jgi:hypothetical protein
MLISSCEPKVFEAEQIILKEIENKEFDFSESNFTEQSSIDIESGIQYGKIDVKDGSQIKFWFLSHHRTSLGDIGGTLYEYPSGERIFCSGYHCCEVFLPKMVESIADFKSFAEQTDGIYP